MTRWFRDTVGPWFGSLRWLLPFLLAATGWYIEWGPGKAPGSGWGLTLMGVVIAYIGLLGAASIFAPARAGKGSGGGLVGRVHVRRSGDLGHADRARSSCSSRSGSPAC